MLNDPSYNYQRWHGTLLLYAVLLVTVFVNTIAVRVLPALEGIILILHVLGFLAILIPLVHLAPQSTADFVFATWYVTLVYKVLSESSRVSGRLF